MLHFPEPKEVLGNSKSIGSFIDFWYRCRKLIIKVWSVGLKSFWVNTNIFYTHDFFTNGLYLGHLSTFFIPFCMQPFVLLRDSCCTCGVFLFSFGYIFEHHFADCNKSVFCKIVYTIVVLYMVRHKMFWTRKRNNFSTLGANHIQFDFCARSCQRKSIGQFYVEQ